MAAATSSPFTFLCLYCFFMLCIHVPCASSTSFSFNFSATTTHDPCGNALECEGDSYFADSVIELTRNDRTRASNASQGRVWYANPVPLWDASTGELASFRSVFSFRITPDGTYNTGDGMAFFLASYSEGSVLGSGGGGGNLGLFNHTDRFNATGDSRVVAVEFDTYPNDWDVIKSQHIGIDVNSIRSVNSTGTSYPQDKGLNLTSDLGMTATVQYDNKTKLLAVDLEIDGAPYQVSSIVDLKSCLPEQVAVGFSAATGSSAELHRVQAWSFSSTLEMKKATPTGMAPAPASQPHVAPDIC